MTDNSILHELIIEPHAMGTPAKAIESLYAENASRNDECLAAWTIEYGALNRVVSLWERRSGNCMTSGAPTESIDWLAPSRMGWRLEPQIEPRTELFTAPFVDLRVYCIKPDQKDEILAAFVENLAAREQYSRCAGMWAARERDHDLMVHLWPYESFEQRMTVREKTFQDPDWLQYLMKAANAFEHLQAMQLIPCALPVAPGGVEDET